MQSNGRKRSCHYYPRARTGASRPRKLSKLDAGKEGDEKTVDNNTSAAVFRNDRVVVPPIVPVATHHNRWAKSKFLNHSKINTDYSILMKYL
ncbi:hypothetical protein ElyMa_002232000 [Elysia marginata]|uniref:PiggyBac transposable element-derived protein domain-containing protein n=1 Tax=Elysia marginata TaxID=1093978 RepID=A0AAV4FWC0_9GAST|nr:hypothetical protein ElyMa_002232000 [Elysia marginata]